jgi:hemolysin III
MSQEKTAYLDRVKIDFSLSKNEEMAGAIIHIIGFALNITAMVLLIVFAAMKGHTKQIVSFALYGAFYNFYYIFSVLYHSFTGYNSKKVFKIFEQGSKYLVFAGMAIPITLVVVGGNLGWIFFGILIFLNLLGIINVALYKISKNTNAFFINFALIVAVVVMLVLSWSQFGFGLLLWLGIAILCALLGLAFHQLKSITFHHGISHLLYVFANVAIFFGFFFHLIY